MHLLLGTAQWGWNTSAAEAFRLLDTWLAAGHRQVDCATNYPINRNPADFRAAEKLLLNYIRAHGLHDLQITFKIGSLDNLRSPEINLHPSFVLMMAEEYLRLFGPNLCTIMLHWDNRDSVPDIGATLEALSILQRQYRLRPGISGIAHPSAYVAANADLGLEFDIQLKHNIFQSQMAHYAPLRAAGQHRFFAYGINGGGVRLEANYTADSTYLTRGGQPEHLATQVQRLRDLLPRWNTAFVRPPVMTINHLGLIYASLNPHLSGIVLGTSSVAQLRDTLDFWRNMETYDYQDVWKELERR